jgi:hypothetical protein
VDDLIAFYRARLDEDEQAASAATDGVWAIIGSDRPYPAYPGEQVTKGRGWSITLKEPAVGDVASELSREDAAHITRHDPARVLAEVEAKRRILDEHYVAQGTVGGQALMVCTRCSDYIERGEIFKAEAAPCKTLKLLALPYADHDDYREEWKP